MVDVAGPRPVQQGDLRSRVVALLLASDGAVLGGATVLSSDKAVTTSEVARSALAKVEALAARPHPRGSLMLSFPQFRGSPGLYPVPVEVQSVDGERGFGVLNLLVSGRNLDTRPPIELPAPVPSGLLGSGEIPEEWSECDVLYNEERQPNQFFLLCLSGRVGGRTGLRFRLDLDGSAPVSILGAPVFKDSVVVGIVASAPRSFFDPTEAGSGFRPQLSVEVLSVAAMAQSGVTPAVRNLLPRMEDGPGTPRPFPTGVEIRQIDGPERETAGSLHAKPAKEDSTVGGAAQSATLTAVPNAEGETAAINLTDADLFARLSPSSRYALARAEGIRLALRKNTLHTEYLIAALFPSWQGFFERSGFSEKDFREIVRQELSTDLPRDYRVPDIEGLPPVSGNVKAALLRAVKYASEHGAPAVWTIHLLYGALSVPRSITVSALNRRGIHREDIRPEDGPEGEGVAPEPTPRPSQPDAPTIPRSELPALGANPTPKVDSDLWSDVDRLGYEAYARTIASLITHKETKPPLTIGIKAPWGAGKTTLMKRVQHLLDGYAELSEGGGTEIVQDLISQVTLQELLWALKGGLKPLKLSEKRSEQGKAYGLPQRITVWFNAWKYQTSEQIWAGMAHCIIAQVTARMDFKDRELFWLRLHARRVSPDAVRRKVYLAIFKYALPYFMIFALVALGALILPVAWYYRFGAIVLSLVPAALASWRKYRDKASETVRDLVSEPDYEGRMGYLYLVESDIRKVLELASAASRTDGNPNGDPLVIFVDDLDRCEPNKVAEVVQAINLFLCGDYPNCIFVLGMEPGMVAAALEVANKEVIEKALEMGLVERTSLVGWWFMEKIVQLPIMIPPPTEAGRRKYVNSLTGLLMESGGNVATFALKESQGAVGMVQISRPPQHGAAEEEKVQSYIKKIGPTKNATEAARKREDVVRQASDEERWAAQEAGKRVYEQTLSERDPVTSLFVDELARLVGGNPRQIKRYVNVFRFYSTLLHSLRLEGVIPSEDLPSDKVLAKFVALSIQWPHAMDCLRKVDAKASAANGRKVTLLELLEAKSKEIAGDGAPADGDWERFVGKKGLGMGAWAEERAFREFLSHEESLCAKEGHGLW